MDETLTSLETTVDVDALGDDLFDGFGDDQDLSIAEDETEVAENEETVEDEAESSDEDHAEEEAEEEAVDTNPEDAQKPETTEAPEDKPAEPEQKKYTLKHLDDAPLEVTAEEMIPLAQKGLDYDRIRSERDAMAENYTRYEQFAEFLESIKGDFASVEDLIDDTAAQLLVKNEAENGRTMSKKTALEKVKANRESELKAKTTPKGDGKPKEEPKQETPQDAEFKRFARALTTNKREIPSWDKLPVEVKTAFQNTGDLLAPYYEYLLAEKDREIKTIKQNQTNKERSTGSRKTKGKGQTIDKLFEGFGDD